LEVGKKRKRWGLGRRIRRISRSGGGFQELSIAQSTRTGTPPGKRKSNVSLCPLTQASVYCDIVDEDAMATARTDRLVSVSSALAGTIAFPYRLLPSI
jgi:hypothetical protein